VGEFPTANALNKSYTSLRDTYRGGGEEGEKKNYKTGIT